MGLDDVVRAGVALADSITQDLQGTIGYRAWVGQDGLGEPIYVPPIGSAAVSVKAIVDKKQQMIRTSDGREVMSKTYVALLRPMTANGTPGRTEPIDERDMIVLPDGTTGPILNIGGFIDGGSGFPYFHEIFLG